MVDTFVSGIASVTTFAVPFNTAIAVVAMCTSMPIYSISFMSTFHGLIGEM
jgi:hypothetical protein